MAFGFAGAGAGAARALQEILQLAEEKRRHDEQLTLQQAAGARADRGLELQQRGFDADEAYRSRQETRQGTLDQEGRARTIVELMPRGTALAPEQADTLRGTPYAGTMESRAALPATFGGRGSGMPETTAVTPASDVFVGSADQQAQDTQRAAGRRLVDLRKRGASWNDLTAAAGEAGADQETLLREDPAAVAARAAAQQAARDKQLQDYEIAQINARTAGDLRVEQERQRGRPAPAPRPSNGLEKRAMNFFNRAQQADTDIEVLEETIAAMGLGAQTRLALAPNVLQSETGQRYTQAQRAFTEARLRKDSGAAIPEHEFDNDRMTYFARPGDTPDTLAQKRRARAGLLASLAVEAGRALNEFVGDDDEAERLRTQYRNRAAGVASEYTVGQEIVVDGRPAVVTGIDAATGKPRVRFK